MQQAMLDHDGALVDAKQTMCPEQLGQHQGRPGYQVATSLHALKANANLLPIHRRHHRTNAKRFGGFGTPGLASFGGYLRLWRVLDGPGLSFVLHGWRRHVCMVHRSSWLKYESLSRQREADTKQNKTPNTKQAKQTQKQNNQEIQNCTCEVKPG